jgi:hypothetical protein
VPLPESQNVMWFKSAIKNHFTIKELGVLKKHLGVWYQWVEDEMGRFLEASMEDFVKGMIPDFQKLCNRSSKSAMTQGLPNSTLGEKEGEPMLHKEY